MNRAIESLEYDLRFSKRMKIKALRKIKYWTNEWMKSEQEILDIEKALKELSK